MWTDSMEIVITKRKGRYLLTQEHKRQDQIIVQHNQMHCFPCQWLDKNILYFYQVLLCPLNNQQWFSLNLLSLDIKLSAANTTPNELFSQTGKVEVLFFFLHRVAFSKP